MMPSTDSRERKAPVAWAGVGVGLLLGAIADMWIQRR